MEKICILDIVEDTIVDGPGFRTSIYSAGCPHCCPGCHNPHSWDIENGYWQSIDFIMDVIKSNPISNVTFSGGEPFFQPQGFIALAKRIKAETDKNIWCYTGFRYEMLMKKELHRELLSYLDVLVDGRFELDQKDEGLRFRGSHNQRIINLNQQIRKEKVYAGIEMYEIPAL
ncbi:MAG: anaerobic ribonucleoside-triphosphate reductase activating protein [Candidatus Azobacteroides sp.]|nr:anaerobic ribonucleoside-triphosphate reductase activating protein [Candidatus Azobacteroides sp.]